MNRTWSSSRRCLGVCAALILTAWRATAVEPGTYSAEIRRTSFGVPHVVARDEAGLGYGVGYAYAQDNVCQFSEVVVTIKGERSRYFGPDAVGGPDFESRSIEETNLDSDFFFKFINAPEHVTRAWQQQNPTSQALIRGYVAGFNRYLAETPAEKLPAACRDAPWVREITELDVIRFMRRLAMEASSIALIKALLAAAPPDSFDAAKTGSFGDSSINFRDVDGWAESAARAGSNAVALGKDATENGRGLLLANPHFPWYGSLRFYQLHITIPGKVDAMGATLGGFPVVRMGFNRNLAWTHTFNTSQHFVLYSLRLDESDPTRYWVDGQLRAMTKQTVSVDVKGEDGRITQRSHDFWISSFGPLLNPSEQLTWNGKTAYTLHDANFSNSRLIDTWYAMDRARSLDEFETAIKSNVGSPWVNTIAADAEGGTLYSGVSVVPNLSRSKQEACTASPHAEHANHGLIVLDASAACELEDSPGAPQPGIFAGSQLPALRRTDFVQNSNDSSWLTNPAAPLTGFAPIISKQDHAQGGRTRIGISQIQARLAGTDGLPGNRFNARTLAQIAFSNRSYFGTLLRDDLFAVCEDTRPVVIDGKSVELAPACAAFKIWDGHANLDSRGYPLAAAWIEDLIEQDDIWDVPFSRQDPVNTPRGIKRSEPAVMQSVRAALGRTVLELQKDRIDASKPWRDIQIIDHNGRRTPIHGGHAGDVYNVIYSVPSAGIARVRSGSSHIQVVAFDEAGPHAQGLLTYSQSTDPASPHFADQASRFSRLEWFPQPFTDEEIKADPEYRTTLISN